MLSDFVREVVGHAAVFAEYSRRKTITAMDVVYALKRAGHTTLYGFDETGYERMPRRQRRHRAQSSSTTPPTTSTAMEAAASEQQAVNVVVLPEDGNVEHSSV